MGLAARFRVPGLWIYWSGSSVICALHIWIDEVLLGVGRGGLGPIRRRRVSQVYQQAALGGQPAEERRDKTETRNRKQGRRRRPGTGWLDDCKSGRSGRNVSHASLLPYHPCSPLAHARYVLRWCGSYADITLSRGGKGWVACGEGGGVQERERLV